MYIQAKFMISLLFALYVSSTQAAAQSTLSGLEVSTDCQPAYQKGIQLVERKMRQGFPFSDRLRKIKLFSEFIEGQPESCRFYASLGMHDAITYLKKQILAEYALELGEADAELNPVVQEIYRQRMIALGEEASLVDVFSEKKDLITKARQEIRTRLNAEADRSGKAVPYGRFVFLGNGARVRSLYEFTIAADGQLVRDEQGQVLLGPGSYQRLARAHFERTKKTVEQYLDWSPGIFFSKDSFWYGSFRRFFSSKPSLRELKEEGYFKSMRLMMSSASQLKLDITPYREMYQLMLNKQRGLLARDLQAYDTVDRYKWAALFVPVGMYVGAAAMVGSGWMAAVPATSSGFFLGGSLSYAANVSGLLSLSVIASYGVVGTYHAYQKYKSATAQGRDFRMSDALDIIALATIQSFPMAAIAPVAVGGSMYGAKAAFIQGRSLLLRSLSVVKNIRQLGVAGSARQVVSYAVRLPGKIIRLPKFLFHKWLQAWYRNPKLLLTHYGVDLAFTVLYDCGYRELRMHGENKCYFKDKDGGFHINKQFLFSLGGTVIIGPLGKPIALIKNFGLRWATYRAFGVFSSALIQLAISGSLDKDRIVFDELYFATAGTATGEISRTFKLSKFVTKKSIPTQALLIILFKAFVEKPVTTPLYLNMQARYLDGHPQSAATVKELVRKWALIDISDFSDDDIRGALDSLELDADFMQKIRQMPDEDTLEGIGL